LITRGVDRRDIFHSAEDHAKFLTLLAAQKAKLPFYLYAYCLMTNHLQQDAGGSNPFNLTEFHSHLRKTLLTPGERALYY
jgi:hypothetical protein